ncbi:hypothetical protein THAOC_18652 [Thalassiosira oceanica]|uniref:RING-type domain-containing protein n=1 Tax=Thalassiosira oceanica TaxID=159749 RepID=K0S6M0_THAOC|nr:hypothetical protein THAOC_18652 [Thalassiosira oceanica]|eukprot:EJK60930.1 hypothetical protein THAOC_18652 [Thalassiosira oceanica]
MVQFNWTVAMVQFNWTIGLSTSVVEATAFWGRARADSRRGQEDAGPPSSEIYDIGFNRVPIVAKNDYAGGRLAGRDGSVRWEADYLVRRYATVTVAGLVALSEGARLPRPVHWVSHPVAGWSAGVARRGSSKHACPGLSEGASLKGGPGPRVLRDTLMKICGACELALPDDSYSEEQRARRQSIRRCEECVAAGNQLVLMKKGRTRSEADDCPICQLPLPFSLNESTTKACCMKRVCDGCALAAAKRGMEDCPFCRTPIADESQIMALVQARVAKGDPEAIYALGCNYRFGNFGLKKDVTRAVELYERAAKLGVKEAHYNLGVLYANSADGEKVDKDMAKAIRHYEAAAMTGDVYSRFNLGIAEYNAGNYDLSLQHMMISAKLGQDRSLSNVKAFFMAGRATKADYAAALRGYQNAIEEMSSPDRDEAKAWFLQNGRK